MSDQYLMSILQREAVDTGLYSPVRNVQTVILPVISAFAPTVLLSMNPSGSFAKGTANKSGTDIDLFISLSENTEQTLKEIYERLFRHLEQTGYKPKKQNVSINVSISGYDVDLVPAKRQNVFSTDHSLYRRRADTWMKTNVDTHITTVRAAGHFDVTRILKLWRSQINLDFPSFYIELAVINALRYELFGTLSERVVKCLEYLRDSLPTARIVDPANTNNVISDELTATERQKISMAAGQALRSTWDQVVR